MIFFHIPKTGGQSVAKALREHAPEIVQLAGHEQARCVADVFDLTDSFAFIREPIERTISLWRYFHTEVSWEEFHWRFVNTRRPQCDEPVRYAPQWVYVCDSDGNQLVPNLYRFCDLQRGLDWQMGRHIPLTHENPSKRTEYPNVTHLQREQMMRKLERDYILYNSTEVYK